MKVVTVRVREDVSKAIDFLTREKNRTKADLIRELMSAALAREETRVCLLKYRKKEMTLRMLAKRLNIPLWKAYELASKVEHPYSRADLQRDLKLIGN